MDKAEYHVASYVVRTQPEDGPTVAEHINSMRGLEVHAEEQGKLVVTAEASNVRTLAELTSILEGVDSVVTVAPIYHEYSRAGDSNDSQ